MKFNAFERDESGFTMVEIMVVVGIIAILALIATPIYLNQRKAAWNSAVQNDVSATAVYIEQNKQALGGYLDYAGGVPGVKLSDSVTINVYGEATMQKRTACVEGWNTKSPTDTRWSFNIIERQMKKGSCI
jgi:prepilin-type N-terminal cleavage/methylation domain-containing protein